MSTTYVYDSQLKKVIAPHEQTARDLVQQNPQRYQPWRPPEQPDATPPAVATTEASNHSEVTP